MRRICCACSGAEVIKIEAPDRGDAMRYYGNDRRYDGMAPAFIAVNAGKKSITLDLKRPGRAGSRATPRRELGCAAREFPARRDGTTRARLRDREPAATADRLLLGIRLRPAGPAAGLAGHRQHRAGHERHDDARRRRRRRAHARRISGRGHASPGQTAAFAILAALFRRERQGRGEYIDVAMFDASIAFMTSAAVPYLVTGRPLERTGNTGYSGQPTSAIFSKRAMGAGSRSVSSSRLSSKCSRASSAANDGSPIRATRQPIRDGSIPRHCRRSCARCS